MGVRIVNARAGVAGLGEGSSGMVRNVQTTHLARTVEARKRDHGQQDEGRAREFTVRVVACSLWMTVD